MVLESLGKSLNEALRRLVGASVVDEEGSEAGSSDSEANDSEESSVEDTPVSAEADIDSGTASADVVGSTETSDKSEDG